MDAHGEQPEGYNPQEHLINGQPQQQPSGEYNSIKDHAGGKHPGLARPRPFAGGVAVDARHGNQPFGPWCSLV